jgi:23S rRNA maturation mini-RNase III
MSKNIQVRDVPESVHSELARQAEQAGMSLNRYVLKEFERIARRGRNAEILDRAAADPVLGLSSGSIVDAIRELRDE